MCLKIKYKNGLGVYLSGRVLGSICEALGLILSLGVGAKKNEQCPPGCLYKFIPCYVQKPSFPTFGKLCFFTFSKPCTQFLILCYFIVFFFYMLCVSYSVFSFITSKYRESLKILSFLFICSVHQCPFVWLYQRMLPALLFLCYEERLWGRAPNSGLGELFSYHQGFNLLYVASDILEILFIGNLDSKYACFFETYKSFHNSLTNDRTQRKQIYHMLKWSMKLIKTAKSLSSSFLES